MTVTESLPEHSDGELVIATFACRNAAKESSMIQTPEVIGKVIVMFDGGGSVGGSMAEVTKHTT